MRSSSSRSPDARTALLQRFTEASRRAEILARVGAARSREALGAQLTADVASAYDAEISFLLERPSPKAGPQLVAATGLRAAQRARLCEARLLEEATAGAETTV